MKPENTAGGTGLRAAAASVLAAPIKMEEDNPLAYKPKYIIHHTSLIV